MLKQIINQEPSVPAVGLSRPPQPPAPFQAPPPNLAAARPANSSKNILSSDVQIVGNLKVRSDLLIDGSIEGEVNSEGCLTVGENGRVKGDIKSKSVTIFGKISGNLIVTDRCQLMATAELIGDIRAGALAIEEGAVFLGASTVGRAARG